MPHRNFGEVVVALVEIPGHNLPEVHSRYDA